jgi:hypothetical protein
MMSDARRDQVLGVAEELTQGMQACDPEALERVYHPDAIVWHNTDRVELSIGDLLGTVAIIRDAGTCTMRVDDREATDAGFVQAHTASYTFNDGTTAEIQAAMIAKVDDDGLITRLDEYLDGAALTPLVAVIMAAAEQPAGGAAGV